MYDFILDPIPGLKKRERRQTKPLNVALRPVDVVPASGVEGIDEKGFGEMLSGVLLKLAGEEDLPECSVKTELDSMISILDDSKEFGSIGTVKSRIESQPTPLVLTVFKEHLFEVKKKRINMNQKVLKQKQVLLQIR